MALDLDIYVLTNLRDRETIDRFVNIYVDREASEDRNDEELMMLPLTEVEDGLQAAARLLSLDEFDWEPALTLSNIIDRGLRYPRRAFAVYLNPIDKSIDQVTLCFTVDNQIVFGLSIDDEGKRLENEKRARKILEELMQQFNSRLGLIIVENAPPFSEIEFLAMISAPLTMHYLKR